MNLKEKLYDVKDKKAKAVAEARTLAEDGKGGSEEFAAKMAEVDAFNAEITGVEKLLAVEEKEADEAMKRDETAKGLKKGIAQGQSSEDDGYAKAVKEFAAHARTGFPKEKAASGMMNEGAGADGGYTVPEDIVNRAIELRDSEDSLLSEVTVVNVSAPKGRRTFKTRGQHTGFLTVEESKKFGKTATPQFTTVNYNIEKRGGYLPVTNELLEDSDEAIANDVITWLGGEARVTANNEILAVLTSKPAKKLDGLDSILAAWISLGAQFRADSAIYTNDDGLLYIATLKDANGRYLLSPNPSEPSSLRLACGPFLIPIKCYSNETIPTTGGHVPMIIGNLKEGVFYWDRRQLTIKESDVAVAGELNAFEEDLTLWRASLRDDCTERDGEAWINGYLDISAKTGGTPATLGELTVTSVAGTASGDTKLTVSPDKDTGNVYKYKVAASATAVTPGQSVQSWTLWDGTSDITAETGKVITLVEATSDYKAVKAGSVTVTAKA